jgi:hypothetical protein
MGLYSGDEELADQDQNPELDDEWDDYDHDFEPPESDEEDYDEYVCEVCGESEGSSIHGN